MAIVGVAEVQVKPQTTGFGPETEAAIKAALGGLSVNIDLRVDPDGLRAEVEAAVAAATAGTGASIDLHVDSTGLPAEVERAAEIAAAEADILLGVDVDSGDLRAKVAAATSGAGGDVNIPVDANTHAFESEVDRVVREADHKEAHVRVSADSANLKKVADLAGVNFADNVLRVALLTIRNAGIAELATATASALTSLSGAAISAASALGSLGAAGAAIPSILGSIAQAAGVAGLALGGIGGALKAYTAAQKAAGAAAVGGGSSAASSAKAQRDAARSVEQATRSVADAERSAADAAETSARRIEDAAQRVIDSQAAMADSVESAERRLADSQRNLADAQEAAALSAERDAERVLDAERNLARAQRDERHAQEDLTAARKTAAADLVKLRQEVERLSNAEADARARLEAAKRHQAQVERLIAVDLTGVSGDQLRAQEKLAEAQDQAAAGDPRAQAARDVADAEQSLQDVLERQAEAQQKLNEAQAAGVEGSDRVVAATERLADAQDHAADSARSLAAAQAESLRDASDAQRRISDAMRDTDDAAHELAKTQVEGARRIADAQRDLADAEKEASRSREDSARRIEDAQQRLADAIENAASAGETASNSAAGAANRYQAALDLLAPSQRRFVEFLVTLQPTLKATQEIAAAGLLPGLEESIRKVLPVLDDLTPVIDGTARKMAELANETADLVSSPAFRSELVAFGKGNIDILDRLGAAGISGADALLRLSVAGQPLAQHFADLAARAADYVDKSLAAGQSSGALASFFERLQDRIDRVFVTVGFLAHGLANVFTEARPQGDQYLGLLERLAAKFDLITERAKESGALRDFFESTRAPLEAVGRLLGDLVEGLAKIGTANQAGFTQFIDQLDQKLLPAVLGIVENLNPAFLESLVNLGVAAANFFNAFLTASPVFTLVVESLTELVGAVTFLGTEIPVVSPILIGLVTVFSTLGTVVAAVKLGTLISELTGSKAAINAIETAVGRMRGELEQVDADGKVIQRTGALTAGFNALGKAASIAAILVVTKTAFDQLNQSLDDHIAKIASSSTPYAEFQTTIKEVGKVFPDLRGNIKFVEGAFHDLAKTSPAAAAQVIKDAKAQGKETQNLEDILASLIDEKARQGITEDEVSRKVQAATDKIKDQTDAQGQNTRAARDAANTLLELSNAEVGTEAAYDRFTQALLDNQGATDSNTEAGRNNISARNDLLGAIQREVDEMAKAAEAGQLDTARKDELIGRLRELSESSYPGVADQAKRYLDQLLAIPEDKGTKLSLDSAEAQERLDRFLAAYNQLAPEVKVALHILGIPTIVDGRAVGGPVKRNRAYIVGEHRAELFVPDEDGRIIPEVPPIRRQVTDSIAAMVEGLDLTARIRIVPDTAAVSGTTTNVSAVANDDVSAIARSLSDLERDLRRGLATNTTTVRVSDGQPGASGTASTSVGGGGLTVHGLTIAGMPVNITLPPGFPVTDPEKLRQFILDVLMKALEDLLDKADLGRRGVGVG